MYGRPQGQVKAPSQATSSSDSGVGIVGSSLLVQELRYLRFGDSSEGFSKDENIFMGFVDTKCGWITEWTQIMILFPSIPDDDIFELESLSNPLVDAINVERIELILFPKIHDNENTPVPWFEHNKELFCHRAQCFQKFRISRNVPHIIRRRSIGSGRLSVRCSSLSMNIPIWR